MEEDEDEDDRIRRLRLKQLTCPICDKVFSRSGNRNRHQLNHFLAVKTTTFKCDQCDATFCQQRYLNQHKQKFHERKKRLKTCDLCGEKLRRSRLGSHRLKFHPKDFYRSSRNRVERRHSSNLKRHSTCIFCNKNNKPFTIANLHRHILRDIGERPFFCRICGAEFVEKADLKRHRRNKFRGQCGEIKKEKKKKSRSKNDTNRKKLIKKLEAKLAKLTKEVESQGENQDQHRPKVGRDTPFLCSICYAAFRNKSKLNDHKKNHVEVTY